MPDKPVSSGQELLEAVLVWDLRAIAAADDPGANAFRSALGSGPWQQVDLADDPLSRAAAALLQERNGNLDAALPVYRALAEDSDGLISLLGLCLLAWTSSPEGDAALERASEVVADLPRSQLKARLLAKLAAFAYDRRAPDQYERLLRQAFEAAAERTELRRALFFTALNAGLVERPISEEVMRADDDDPLVDHASIDALALRSARGELTDLLQTRARSPWSWQFRAGRTPADEIITAELQASWAGALWKRSELRKQIGAQLLQGRPRDQELVYGLSMWLLGGGDQVGPIIATYEPQFGQATADDLLTPLIEAVSLPGIDRYRLAQVAVALWDEASEDVLLTLLDLLSPDVGIEPAVEEARRFWRGAAIRVPSEIGERMMRLDLDTRIALVSELPDEALDQLPDGVVKSIIEELEGRSVDRGNLLYVEGRLRRRVGSEPRPHTGLPAYEVVEAVIRDPTLVPDEELRRAEAELLQSFEHDVEQARQGSASFGGRSVATSLALVARARQTLTEELLETLINVASDTQVPGHLRLETVLALAQLAADDLVTTENVQRIASIPEEGAPSFFAPTPPALLRVARLLAKARALDEEEEAQLLALARDEDARVRQFAVNAVGLALRHGSSVTLRSALVAGLFDPEEDVVLRALASLRDAKLSGGTFDQTTVQRLRTLFNEYGRYVRASVVSTARSLIDAGYERDELVTLLEDGKRDRSAIVRSTAASQA